MDDHLFPLLCDSDSQMVDWWTIRSFAHLNQRIEAMKWLSSHDAGQWIIYVVMHDFLEIKVIQHLHDQKVPQADIHRRVAQFFSKNVNKTQISTISLQEALHSL